ncbi:MAG: hypothetical protein DBY36_03245 [Clostridiales bacterium]|nr:MAG: hypothetical protein DBY36_03245 [Clostridiales bacterium]
MSSRALSGALGIDTSNYTTSAAAYAPELPQPVSAGRLLEVGDGGCGLRQSDAVFAHVKNLPEIVAEAMRRFDGEIAAVGVSARPRDAEGSYMPCFLTGVAAASAAASALRVPLYEFSHQANHVAAAAFAAGRPELLRQPFLAWHLSGGTSELLLVRPDGEKIIRCERVGGTSDLAAGQAIDRAGVMLGLRFPCGRALDALSLRAETPPAPARLSVKGLEMSLSGLENKARALAEAQETPERIARFVLETVLLSVARVTEGALRQYGALPILCAGGVMCNTLIRARMEKQFSAHFADAAFSADNAAGCAVLAYLKNERARGRTGDGD